MSTLLGRDHELGAVHRALDAADSGSGRILLVEGDPGIGKTALVAEAREAARRRGLRVLSARGTELEGDLDFAVVRRLLGPVVGDRTPEGAAAGAAAALGSSAPSVTGGQGLFATLHGLHWLVADLARSAPLLLAVDDAQWCDVPSLRFLAHLAHRVDGLAVSVLVATRPGPSADRDALLASMTAEPVADLLAPGPLDEDEVRELVTAHLGRPDPAVVRACADATGGNPFLLRELVAELARSGDASSSSAADRIARLVPREVGRSVRTRLNGMPDQVAAVARAAAVLGDGTTLPSVAALAGVDPSTAARAVDDLVSARLLLPAERVTFLHPLLRSAVETTLGPAALATAHRRAATVLAAAGEPEDAVVAHRMLSSACGDATLVEDLRRAARRAAGRGAQDVAARMLGRALAEPPPPEARGPVLLELGIAEMRSGCPDAVEHLTAAVEAMPDPVRRARATLPLARVLLPTGRVPEAVDRLGAAVDALRACDGSDPGAPPEVVAELVLELEAELVTIASQDPGTRELAVARHAARGTDPDPGTRAGCLLLASMALEEVYSARSRVRAVALAEQALAGGHLMAEQLVARLLGVGIALTLSGRPGRAVDVWDEAIAEVRTRGDVEGFALASAFRGYAGWYTGDLQGSLADCRAALDAGEDTAFSSIARGFATAWLVYGLLDTGELDEADALLTDNAVLFRHGVSSVHYLLSARGQLRLAGGRVDDAVEDLQECGRRLAASGSHSVAACRWRAPLVLALHARGEQERAGALAADTVRAALAWGAPLPLAEALRAAGACAPGGAGVELLREAVSVAGPVPLERARALVALGAALRRDGQRAAAREPLRNAVEIALDRGATAIADRARSELVETGARPRRLRSRGVDALTATERRVVAMAADGLTNRQLAQALFVSEKTVETHLGHAYAKLGITARSQLAAALDGR